jgi:hypothetical protein
MFEHICMYDEQYIQFHVVRLMANNYEDALDRFKVYLESIGVMVYREDDLWAGRFESIKEV